MADPPMTIYTEEQLKKLKTYAANLPYPIESSSEMQSLLDLYLTRITQCILAKDYDTGFLQWDAMLAYWLMLKHPMPKAKRIGLAKVYFNLCLVPGVPLQVVSQASDTLNVLLRSKKKLSVEDMRLPWKPIWAALSSDLFLSRRQFEITQTTYLMATLAETSRRFFHPACGDEMLDIMLPDLNGQSLNSILATQYYLNTFLPLSHPTWLPMMMRLWGSINSYMFDDRHFALLAQLAELHMDPTVSDPAALVKISDDARFDEHGLPEQQPRTMWASSASTDRSAEGGNYAKVYASKVGLNGSKKESPGDRGSLSWKGLFKDVGIFSQEEWDLIMCKCLASMEIPLADGGLSLSTGPIADEQAGFEFSRLPKVTWRIYSLAKLIVYSMAPDGKPMARSGTATPFEIPVTNGHNYFSLLPPRAEEPVYLAGCKALDSLAKLIVSTESFFHPSNSGSWTADLTAFLKYIVFEFNKRWYEELKPDCKVPMNRRLTGEIRRELVRSLRTPAFLAMFSPDSDIVANVQSALKSMTVMEPDLIVPPVLERAIPALEALVETERTIAVIRALGAISIGLVSRDLYYAGAKHLLPILELLLPGIDLNDPQKTMCTTAFLIEIAQCIKFGDLTEVEPTSVSEDVAQASWSPKVVVQSALPTVRVDTPPDPEDRDQPRLSDENEDSQVRDSTSGFANWVTSFIRRVILLLENLPEEDPAANPGAGGGGYTETSVVDSVMETCSQICVHLSEPLFDLVLELVYDFATTTVRSNAVRAVHQLVACVANANPQKTLARFVPFCMRSIRVELEHGASSSRSVNIGPALPSDATFHWNLAILRGTLSVDGRAVLPYKDDFMSLLVLLHAKTLSKRGFTFTGRVVSSLLLMATNTYPLDDMNRYVNDDEWKSPSFSTNHHKTWGRLYSADEVQVQWHTPSADELSFSLDVLTSVVEPTLAKLEVLIQDGVKRDSVWSNDFCRYLCLVRDALNGLPTLWQEYISEEEALASAATSDIFHELPEFIASVAPIKSGFALEDPSDPRYQAVAGLRKRVGAFLHDAALSLRDKGDENAVPPVLMLISTCRVYLLEYGDSRDNYYSQRDVYSEELGLSRRYSGQKKWPRAIFFRRAKLYHTARLRWNFLERRRSPGDDAIIDDIVQWTMWPYATVRAYALDRPENSEVAAKLCKPFYSDSQACLEHLTNVYDGIRRRCLPVLYTNLQKGSEDDKMKGALYTLNMAIFSKFTMGEPSLMPDCVEHLFGCQWNEKPTIQNCVSSLAERCLSTLVEPCFLSSSIDYPALVHSVQGLKNLLPARPADKSLVARCELKRKQRHNIQEVAVANTTSLLLKIANANGTHWRYSIIAIRMLRTLVRRDIGSDKVLMQYLLSQANADHPSMRYYAQRAIMKASRYIKIRTFSRSAEDLALLRNRNPLRRKTPVKNRTSEHTLMYLESFRVGLDRSLARQTPLLQDKVSSGWLVWKNENRYLLPTASTSALRPWELASSEAVKECIVALCDLKFWEGLSSHYAEENHQDLAVMDNISCIKSLSALVEDDCFEVLRPAVEKLIADPDQNKQRAAAELLGGLIGGSKNWPTDAQDRLWAWGMPLIDKTLTSTVKTDTLSIWTSFLDYVLTNRDPRRVQRLIDWIVNQGLSMDFNAESSFEAVKIMCFVRSLIDALEWRFTAWSPAFLTLYWNNISSEHDEVLSYIALSLASFCKLYWRPTPSLPIAEVFVRECATKPPTSDIMGVEHAYHMEPFLKLVEGLPILRSTRFTGARAPRSPYDRTFTTVIRWLTEGLQDVNAKAMFQYILPLLPELLQAAELQDSDDLAGRAQLLLTSMCAVTPPSAAVRKILETLFEAIKSSSSWRIRLNSLPILQILYFRQVPIIEEDMVIKIQDTLSACLSDEVIEVRERAATTLSGILRCSPRRTILLLKDRFVRQASRITLPARNTPSYTTKLRELHAAILGVTALIDAFPYSVPSWLPELIGDVLSRHAYDPIPVSRTIRDCASRFKETHQDTWHEDALKFNEEQMGALTTLLAGPSYYA